jgi:hypothetical protein
LAIAGVARTLECERKSEFVCHNLNVNMIVSGHGELAVHRMSIARRACAQA